jgi:4-methyl-5(b-hydroxyethyl)-thiazole monophosphate biosynthesis
VMKLIIDNIFKQFSKQRCRFHTTISFTPKVLVPIANGTEEIEVVTVIDVLRRAGADVHLANISVDSNNLSVVCSRDVQICTDTTILTCLTTDWDMIVLSGGAKGANNFRDSKHLNDVLRYQNQSKRYIAAICAAPAIVLASNGILNSKSATCYPALSHMISRNYLDEKVVVDGHLITSQGPATAMLFALTLVERLFGRGKAVLVAEELLFEYK